MQCRQLSLQVIIIMLENDTSIMLFAFNSIGVFNSAVGFSDRSVIMFFIYHISRYVILTFNVDSPRLLLKGQINNQNNGRKYFIIRKLFNLIFFNNAHNIEGDLHRGHK